MLGIALDELKENDYVEEFEDGKIVVDEELLDMYKGFEIDYQQNWFSKGFTVIPEGAGASRC